MARIWVILSFLLVNIIGLCAAEVDREGAFIGYSERTVKGTHQEFVAVRTVLAFVVSSSAPCRPSDEESACSCSSSKQSASTRTGRTSARAGLQVVRAYPISLAALKGAA